MDNFEAFYSIISSSINLLFLRRADTTKSGFSKIIKLSEVLFFSVQTIYTFFISDCNNIQQTHFTTHESIRPQSGFVNCLIRLLHIESWGWTIRIVPCGA